MDFRTRAAYRLKATAVYAFAPSTEVSEWWTNLPKEQKRDYLEQHPNSKYAEQAIAEGEATNHQPTPGLEPGSKTRKSIADSFRKAKSTISKEVKRALPLVANSASALKALSTGKKLDHHQKEALHEIGHIVLKAGATHLAGDVHTGAAIAKISITAVQHAIDQFKSAKAKNPKQDDVDTFVDAVADGLENAKEAPVPAEHAKPRSSYRKALAKAVKSASAHTLQILEKSFSNVKPATQGLTAIAQGKPISEPQKRAMKQLGKYALATTIATLPGGLVVHLAAGAGSAAVMHAFKAVRGETVTGRELLGRFVESIGEGLEHAAIHHLAGESHSTNTLEDSPLSHGIGMSGLDDAGDLGGHEDTDLASEIGRHGLGLSDAPDHDHDHDHDSHRPGRKKQEQEHDDHDHDEDEHS